MDNLHLFKTLKITEFRLHVVCDTKINSAILNKKIKSIAFLQYVHVQVYKDFIYLSLLNLTLLTSLENSSSMTCFFLRSSQTITETKPNGTFLVWVCLYICTLWFW